MDAIKRIYKLGATAIVRGCGALMEIVFSLLVIRQLGLNLGGQFLVALTTVLLILAIARAGYDFSIIRVLSSLRANKKSNKGFNYIIKGAIRVLILAIILTVIFFFLSKYGLTGLGSETNQIFGLLIFAIFPISMLFYFAESFKGLMKPIIGQSLYGAPIYLLSTIFILFYNPTNSGEKISIIFVFSSYISLLIAFSLILIYVGITKTQKLFYYDAQLDSQSLKLVLLRPATLAANWLPIWIIGAQIGATEAGIYAISNRVAAAIMLVVIAVEATTAPKFAEYAHIKNEKDQRLYLRNVCLLSGLTACAFGLMLFLSTDLLFDFLGESKTQEHINTTSILILAYSINGFFAPTGTYLLMTNRNAKAIFVSLFSLAMIAIFAHFVVQFLDYKVIGFALLTMFVVRGISNVYLLRS